jgi:DNA repair exonuclease SbcCD ATPase subunit
MNDIEDNDHFKMPLDDEVEEAVIPAEVDELRLEKISTRVTIISILIPVLIVIVLTFAYLDIKKQVVQTEDTGSMGIQHLSKDVESRFSSLSLRQARLEEQLAAYIDRNEQSMARIEIRLKNLDEATKALPKGLVSQKALNESVDGLQHKLANIASGLEDAQGQMGAASDQWHAQMDGFRTEFAKLQEGLKNLRADLAQITPELEKIDTRLSRVEDEKMDKPAMDLALSLEGLRIKQDLKASLDALATKVEKMDKQIGVLKEKILSPTPLPPKVEHQGTRQKPAASEDITSTELKEQTPKQ